MVTEFNRLFTTHWRTLLWTCPQTIVKWRNAANALEDYVVERVRCWGETPVSGLCLCEDWGSQSRLMISLDIWRKYFKPHYRRVFDEIHRAGQGPHISDMSSFQGTLGRYVSSVFMRV
jgi:hypothetical protein